MQQPCKQCGYESPEMDKFCRQCGGQLPVENEVSAAVTLNHGRVEPNPSMASVGTGRLPPSVGDVIAADTERYYSPPQYASAQANIERPQYASAQANIERPQYASAQANIERPPTFALLNPNPPTPSRFKSFSGFMKGVFMFLLVAGLLVATGLAVHFADEADNARWELWKRDQSGNGREQADGRAQNDWDQMEEALRLAHQATEKAASAGATLTISGEKPIDLSKYTYPNAQVEAMIGSTGNEALSLLATDNFDDVQKFYERLFGKPVLQMGGAQGGNQRKKLLFQSPTLPSILIKVEEIERRKLDRNVPAVKITILHSFFRFPRFNEQAQNLK
jgi:hypothetical protein